MDILEIVKNYKGVVAITGSAGSGKTTLSNKLCNAISNSAKYSADCSFIGDSAYRKKLLNEKQKHSVDNLIDACNQFNWWDWEEIEQVIDHFRFTGNVVGAEAYDRDTGKAKALDSYSNKDILIYEGAILGPDSILNKVDKIFYLTCDPQKRLIRLLDKDSGRRDVGEITARFLITQYSESVYYKHIFNNYQSKITVIDEKGNIVSPFNCDFTNPDGFYLPIKINL